MKQSRTFPIAILTLAASRLLPSLHAGAHIARGELNLRGTAAIVFTDRVSPNADSSSDTIYTFTPEINYHREDSRLDLNAELSTPFTRYGSNSVYNSDDINFSMSGKIPYNPASRVSGNWDFGYFNGVESNLLLNRNLDTERLGGSITSNVRFLRKLSLRAGASYYDRSTTGVLTSYQNSNRTTSYEVGIQGHELLFSNVGGYVSYRWQKRETTEGSINSNIDDTDNGINFGVTGQILPERLFPKLDADLSFGIASSKDIKNRGGRRNHLTLDGSLSYPPTSKTNVTLRYNRNLSVSDDDRTVLASRINLGFQYTPRQRLSFGAQLGQSTNEFLDGETDRTDDRFTAGVNARYLLRPNWSVFTYYNFRDSSSDVAIADYTSSVFGVSTTLSY